MENAKHYRDEFGNIQTVVSRDGDTVVVRSNRGQKETSLSENSDWVACDAMGRAE